MTLKPRQTLPDYIALPWYQHHFPFKVQYQLFPAASRPSPHIIPIPILSLRTQNRSLLVFIILLKVATCSVPRVATDSMLR